MNPATLVALLILCAVIAGGIGFALGLDHARREASADPLGWRYLDRRASIRARIQGNAAEDERG